MPHAQFRSVYAVSSEDPAHPASNLLKIQSGKKWRTKTAGEKSAFVILQLEQPEKIVGIDIGNEHSSFAMVAVGKMGCSTDDFKEILITSSFMTPIESKNSTNINRVRCFTKNALVETIADEKWDLVKALCTQPFNRHVPYGLSLITVHVAASEASSSGTTASSTKTSSLVPEKFLNNATRESRFGFLKLREDSSDSETDGSQKLFNRWRHSMLSSAVDIRAASNPSALKNLSESVKTSKFEMASRRRDSEEPDLTIRDRNRDDLLYDKDDDVPNERLERKIAQDQTKLQKETNKKHDQSLTKKTSENRDEDKVKRRKPDEISDSSKKRNNDLNSSKRRDNDTDSSKMRDNGPSSSKKNHDNEAGSSKKRPSSSSSPNTKPAKKLKHEKPIEYRPFNKLLQGVTLVISGIQNPDRATLRQKTIDLGARYKPDWDDNCTHLICAFQNTPKYNQVKGKGKIVTRHWIEKCHSLKKRLPWRRYALADRDADKPESEDEIHDLSLKPAEASSRSNSPRNKTPEKSHSPPPSPQRKESIDDTLASYDLGGGTSQSFAVSSGSDTEEEIEKTKRTLSEKLKTAKETKKGNLFEVSTEEDETIKAPNGRAKNTEFFQGLKFYLSENIPATELIKLRQYIKQFKGDVVEKMTDSDFAITKEAIEKRTEFKGEVVNPLWVLECYDMECRIPTRRYLL